MVASNLRGDARCFEPKGSMRQLFCKSLQSDRRDAGGFVLLLVRIPIFEETPMSELPDFGKYDLSFRPATYWSESKRALANVTGTLRRQAFHSALEKGGVPSLHLLNDDRDESYRQMLGAIHPAMRSGEDLTPVRRNETEIARLTLDSIHGEVTSIRARSCGGRFLYRVEEEEMRFYGYRFVIKPKSSKVPLSLRELILLINSATTVMVSDGTLGTPGLVVPHWSRGYDFNFTSVSSCFYPQLRPWFRDFYDFWKTHP